MSRRTPITRRRFVGLVAAGGATLAAGGAASDVLAADAVTRDALAANAPAKEAPASGAKALTPFEKELERQKAGTETTLKTIREFGLPPGGDLPVVFRPLHTPRPGKKG